MSHAFTAVGCISDGVKKCETETPIRIGNCADSCLQPPFTGTNVVPVTGGNYVEITFLVQTNTSKVGATCLHCCLCVRC